MRNLIVRLIVNAVALSAAAYLVAGVRLSGSWTEIGIVALVFGLVNAFIKPIVKIFAFPLWILTLGLITLVINALMLQLTARLTPYLEVDGFGPAFWGSLVISVVSWVLSLFLKDDDED